MVLSLKDHLLTLLRVSNTANLPTKPDQAAEAGRFERKSKSSIKSSTSPKPKRKQNKEVKTSLLA